MGVLCDEKARLIESLRAAHRFRWDDRRLNARSQRQVTQDLAAAPIQRTTDEFRPSPLLRRRCQWSGTGRNRCRCVEARQDVEFERNREFPGLLGHEGGDGAIFGYGAVEVRFLLTPKQVVSALDPS